MGDFLFRAFLISSSLLTHSIRGVLTSLSKNAYGEYEYSTIMATMLSEFLKLLISFVIFRVKERRDPMIRKAFSLKEIMLWSIPAILYAIGHNMYYSILSLVDDPIIIQVFGSLETVIVGVFSVVILRKRLTGIHWASMVLMCDSVASIQLSRSDDASFSDFPVYPAVLTIISTAIVACAGVCIERLMKEHKDMSIFQQNIWLYFWGTVVNFIFLFAQNGYGFMHQMTFKNFNTWAILTVACTVYMGVVTGAILKYLSSVVKAFTSSVSLVITSVISAYTFNLDLSLPFDLAVVNLAIAIYLYKTAPKAKNMINGKQEIELKEIESMPTDAPDLSVLDEVIEKTEKGEDIEIGSDEEEIDLRK